MTPEERLWELTKYYLPQFTKPNPYLKDKSMKLTAERCDECITLTKDGKLHWPDSCELNDEIGISLDEAELFFLRGLAAVKRARESEG